MKICAPIPLIIALLLCGCATTETPHVSKEPLREVTLLRMGCLGTCPVYQVTIRSDGSVVYEGRLNVAVKGTQKKKIDPASFDLVWAKLEEINFWNLQERYDHMVETLPDGTQGTWVSYDSPQKWITAIDGERQKRVLDAFGAPKGLAELETLIDSIAGTSAWIQNKK